MTRHNGRPRSGTATTPLDVVLAAVRAHPDPWWPTRPADTMLRFRDADAATAWVLLEHLPEAQLDTWHGNAPALRSVLRVAVREPGRWLFGGFHPVRAAATDVWVSVDSLTYIDLPGEFEFPRFQNPHGPLAMLSRRHGLLAGPPNFTDSTGRVGSHRAFTWVWN